MATPTEWLNEFQVNTGTAATGGQSDPKIIGLNNGYFLVAWVEAASGAIGTEPGSDIIAKIYDAEGGVVRDSFKINTFDPDDERDFELVATHDGFAMAYLDDDIAQVNQTDIRFNRYDFDGNVTQTLTIATENVASGGLTNPSIAANLNSGDDDIMITWTDTTPAGDTVVNGRVIDESGALGAVFDAGSNSSGDNAASAVTVLSNGNFVTAYTEDDTVQGIEFRIVTSAGTSVSNVNVSDSFGGTAVAASEPAVTALAGDGFVVTWTEGGDIKARGYSNTGVSLFNEITVAGGTNSQNEPVVVGLPDGDFVVAWDDDTSGNLFARRFNADGTSDGFTFTVENVGTTSIDIDVTGDGRILFTWLANDGLGEVFASVWDPRPSTIDPDDYDVERAHVLNSDVITTGLAGSTVLAGSGFKTVLGQNGNDTIFSSGAGEYFGGGGNDTITAGNGTNETLDGGTGVDTLITTTFNGNYAINLVTGVTNFAPESFVNFENVTTGNGSDTIVGTSGANIINTGLGNDVIDGGLGNDTINAGDGNDSVSNTNNGGADLINGGAGNDTLVSSGESTIFGGSGNDSIFAGLGTLEDLDGGTGNDTLDTTLFTGSYVVNLATGLTNFAGELFLNFENIVSGIGNDELFGTIAANRMEGGDGSDRILGFAGNDSLRGGVGDDTLNGGDGDDFVEGEAGVDRMFGQAGNDLMDGGLGNDSIEGNIGNDTLRGGDGDDLLRGADGNDSLNGGSGNDTAFGGNDNDTLLGFDGDDSLDGSGGNDFIDGGDGNDALVGETGADRIFGGNGEDSLRGGGGDDSLDGGNDNDLMFGSSGEDTMRGGNGDDTLEGDTQSDDLFGDAGNDVLRGGDGFDFLSGGTGNDTLLGGNGNDEIFGGAGVDLLIGGAQNDTFRFDNTFESSFGASDVIIDMQGVGVAGGDIIDLSNIDANGLVAGDQAFTFLGNVSSAVGIGFGAGALWTENSGGQTRLYGNTDNDAIIELAIFINDGAAVTAADYTAGDFIL